MKVRELMTSDVDMCTMDTSIQEVAAHMLKLDVGSIPITDNGKLAGIITDRDIVTRGVAAQLSLDTPVSKILSTQLITGSPDMDIEDAAELMAKNQIRRLPIVEKERLVGIVSLGDIAVKDPTDHLAGDAIEDISKPSDWN